MSYILEPEKILMNFLRSQVEELTRTTPSLSNRQTTDSQSFNGTGSKTDFVLTNSPIAINTVKVGGTEVYPYQDFNIDLDNKTIKFRVAPVTGTNNVVINFEKGNNWIYPDKPREKMKLDVYPRISFLQIGESSRFKESGGTDTLDSITFQFDILSYKDLLVTIGTDTKEGPDIVTYLARNMLNTFKSGWNNYLLYKIREFQIIGNSSAPFDPGKNIYRRIVQINFLFRNLEEVI